MKAQQRIRESLFPPDQIAMIEEVFEEAWLVLEPDINIDTSPECARVRLANICLLLSRVISNDPGHLRSAAIRAFTNCSGPGGGGAPSSIHHEIQTRPRRAEVVTKMARMGGWAT